MGISCDIPVIMQFLASQLFFSSHGWSILNNYDLVQLLDAGTGPDDLSAAVESYHRSWWDMDTEPDDADTLKFDDLDEALTHHRTIRKKSPSLAPVIKTNYTWSRDLLFLHPDGLRLKCDNCRLYRGVAMNVLDSLNDLRNKARFNEVGSKYRATLSERRAAGFFQLYYGVLKKDLESDSTETINKELKNNHVAAADIPLKETCGMELDTSSGGSQISYPALNVYSDGSSCDGPAIARAASIVGSYFNIYAIFRVYLTLYSDSEFRGIVDSDDSDIAVANVFPEDSDSSIISDDSDIAAANVFSDDSDSSNISDRNAHDAFSSSDSNDRSNFSQSEDNYPVAAKVFTSESESDVPAGDDNNFLTADCLASDDDSQNDIPVAPSVFPFTPLSLNAAGTRFSESNVFDTLDNLFASDLDENEFPAANVFSASDSDSEGALGAGASRSDSNDKELTNRVLNAIGIADGLSDITAPVTPSVTGPFTARFFSKIPGNWLDPPKNEDDFATDEDSGFNEEEDEFIANQ